MNSFRRSIDLLWAGIGIYCGHSKFFHKRFKKKLGYLNGIWGPTGYH